MKPRTVVLIAGILAVLGIGAYAAYQSPWVRSWFARDSGDPAELGKLADKKLQPAPVADASGGWPQWRGPTRDGRAPAGPFRTDWDKNPPKELWRQPVGGGYGSCAVVGGRLYVQDKQGGNERVVCLDAETGKPLWEHAYPAGQAGRDASYGGGPRATPTVQGNNVYTVGGTGRLLALEDQGAAAKVRWEHDLLEKFGASLPQWGVACSPLLLGDLVVVQPGGRGASVVAFDKNSGEVRWKAGSNPPGYSSPVAASVRGIETVFAFTGDALLAIRASDGEVTDEYGWKTQHNGNIATPLVVDDYVFISSGYNAGCALLRAEKAGDGVKLVEVYAKRRRGFQNHHASSVFVQFGEKERCLFGFDNSQLKCIDFNTGTEKEGWEADGVGKGNLILAGGYLVIQTEGGDLCLVEADPKEFKLVAKLPRVLSGRNNWASPTLVNGRLYIRDEQKVICFDVRP